MSFAGCKEIITRARCIVDSYFLSNPSASLCERNQAIELQIDSILGKIDAIKDVLVKAEYWLLRGLAFNLHLEYDARSEECLNKCLKFDPELAEGWNVLGECLWKKGNKEAARNAFQKAVTKTRSPASLRCLSMCSRMLDFPDSKEKASALQNSLELAKEAVKLSPSDGKSQYCLANASFACFFASGQRNWKFLEQAKKAYDLAVLDPNVVNDAEVHFNRAMFYRMDETYDQCIKGFVKALQLDPFFIEPKQNLAHITAYLGRITDCVQKKGKLKQKRLSGLAKWLSTPPNLITFLGPYAVDVKDSKNGKITKLSCKNFADLSVGCNPESVAVGQVVGAVLNENNVPYTFCMVDACSTCFAVTVYNCSNSFGVVIEQTVAIPEPFVIDVKAEHANSKFEFRSIRVSTPEVLIINGKTLSKDNIAFVELSLSNTKASEND